MNLCCQVNGENPKHKCDICNNMMCDDCWRKVKRLPNEKYDQAIKLLRSSKIFYYNDIRLGGKSIKPSWYRKDFTKKFIKEIKEKLSTLGKPQPAGSYMSDGKRITPVPYRYFFILKRVCDECYKKEVK